MSASNNASTDGAAPNKLQVIFVLPSFAGGGAERVMLTLLSSLDRGRFNTKLVVLQGLGPLADHVPAGIPTIDLKCSRVRSGFISLARALKRLRPDIIVSTMGYLNLAVLAAAAIAAPRSRVIVREANAPHATLAVMPFWLTRVAYRALYRRAAAILCPTDGIASALVGSFGLSPNRIMLLPNPVDEMQLRNAAVPVIRHAGVGPRFVMAGRLTRQKGWDLLVDMFAKLSASDAHLTILGHGSDQCALEAAIATSQLSSRVAVLGYVAQPWRYFAGADALLITSRWEGMPNVALEALAVGVPVIATPESGGIMELAKETAHGAVTVGTIGDDFVSAMAKVSLRTDSRLSPSMLPRRFTLEQVAPQFLKILTSVK